LSVPLLYMLIAIYMCFISNFIRTTDSQSDSFLMISCILYQI